MSKNLRKEKTADIESGGIERKGGKEKGGKGDRHQKTLPLLGSGTKRKKLQCGRTLASGRGTGRQTRHWKRTSVIYAVGG